MSLTALTTLTTLTPPPSPRFYDLVQEGISLGDFPPQSLGDLIPDDVPQCEYELDENGKKVMLGQPN